MHRRWPDRIFATAPPEFLLAACCCRWPRGDERLEAIRRAADRPIDWQAFLAIVEWHRVWALVHEGVTAAAIAVPKHVAGRIAATASATAHHNLALAAEASRLQRLFNDARLRIVFLKGVALAVLAYGTLALKHGKDIDILAPQEELEAATGVLQEAGYQLTHPGLSAAQRREILRHGNHFTFVRRDTNQEVELHWGLSVNRYLLRLPPKPPPLLTVALGGNATLNTLEVPELFAYLCAHGAGHGWSRLKWLADLAALLRTRTGQIEQLYRAAQNAGAGYCAGQALLLCDRVFAIEAPQPLMRELRQSARLELLEATALRAILGGHASLRSEWKATPTILVSQYLLGSGLRFLLGELGRQFFRLDDVAAIPLPGWLRFLYPLLRPLSYFWRRTRAV